MRSLFGRFRKKENPKKEIPPPKKEDFDTLIEELDDAQSIINLIGPNGDKILLAMEKAKVKELQEKIINLLPDEFQKKIFRIIARHDNVDLVGFLKQDWKENLRTGFENIAFYLDPKHPLNFLKLPVKGKDFLLWMLQQAKSDNSKDGFANIMNAILKRDICGIRVSRKRIKDKVFPIVLCVLWSRDYHLQFQILMEIMRDIEGGEEFIKNELVDKTKDSFFE